MLDLIEVDEGALDLVERHGVDAGDPEIRPTSRGTLRPHLGKHRAPCPFDEVAGSVAQRDCAAGIQRGEDNLALVPLGKDLAGHRVDYFDDPEVGEEVVASGLFPDGGSTFRERHFGLG